MAKRLNINEMKDIDICEYLNKNPHLREEKGDTLFRNLCEKNRHTLLTTLIKRYKYFDKNISRNDDIINAVKNNNTELSILLMEQTFHRDFTYKELLDMTKHSIKNNNVKITNLILDRNISNPIITNIYEIIIDHSKLIVNANREMINMIIGLKECLLFPIYDTILFRLIKECANDNNIPTYIIIKCIKNLRRSIISYSNNLEIILQRKHYIYAVKGGFITDIMLEEYKKHRGHISDVIGKINNILWINIVKNKVLDYLI